MIDFARRTGMALFLLLAAVMPAAAQTALNASGAGGGSVIVGWSSDTCNSGIAGAIRYNSSNNCAEYCNGTSWTCPDKPCSMTSNLLASWAMDEGAGNTVGDSASSFTGTRVGAGTWVAGYSGTALDFNGTSQYVNIPYNTKMNIAEDFTLAAWIRADATSSIRRIITLPADGTSGGEQYSLLLNSNNLQFIVGDGGAGATLQTPYAVTGSWRHVTATLSGTRMTLYVSGAQAATKDTTTRNWHTAGDMAIGRYSATFPQYFDGYIDDVRIYNCALSAAQVAALAAL